MTKLKNKQVAASMLSWAQAFNNLGDSELANRFLEDEAVKAQAQKVLKRLGVPFLERHFIPLSDFSSNPNVFFEKLGFGKYFASIISDTHGVRERSLDLGQGEVLEFIAKIVAERPHRDFTLLLARYYNNLFGGNIVISKHGGVFLELAKGTHGEMVTGSTTPFVIVEINAITQIPKVYSLENGVNKELINKKLREAVMLAINLLPRDNLIDQDKWGFHPGYYEFILTTEGSSRKLTPIFIDYRDRDIYQLHK